MCCDALDTAFEISKLIKVSPKRNAAFDRIKSENDKDLVASMASRWNVGGESVGSILENYNVYGMITTRYKGKDYWCKNPNVSLQAAFWATPM